MTSQRANARRTPSGSGRLRPHHEIHLTVEHLQQGQQLVDGFAVIRLVEESIQLRGRRSEASNDLVL